VLLMAAGKEEPVSWPPTITLPEGLLQLLSIKIVPSLSVIVK
jgi:hypothetical protein